ncbi:L-aspartate oxidase [Phenylobacterium kunshanense]|uniref:L-aspartate oxidase n=1 Tax=Phenylobacterium kunshanense TaxID=1445034 RepID=A0A328BDT3_9CAUL|nr:L-aspartate oxidase [Phenylobacterium kunshanense]RAK65590.1 L-aspartate oxidase [Phenylobacterium kunshanense]
MERIRHDGVVVVGAGLAGLTAALAAAPAKVLVLTGAPLSFGCSSAWAQGGVAAALSADDAPALHAADTVTAGAGLVVPEVAGLLAEEGPAAVRRLADLGAPFDRTPDGGFAQSLEAAHSRARVARVKGDQAGRAIMDAVVVATLSAPHVQVRTGAKLAGLIQDATGRVRGVVARIDGQPVEILANAVILATGGIGGLYAVTTTPAELTGDGLGLAALAGATIADPEFVQFHPTAIDIGRDPAPLATEALRGEGAKLVGVDGRPFMARYHPDAELAPRDVVARAIHAEREAGRGAFLDAREAVGAHFPEEFPAVFAACLGGGVDPRVQPIPVAPACHYHMGGIATDDEGRTNLPGLYAAGECASTGVHGANRLASNSLLEAAVFGARAGQAARDETPGVAPLLRAQAAPELPAEALASLRTAMSQDAGVVRDGVGLGRLLTHIDALRAVHGEVPALVAARLVAASALARRESRGGHFRSDFPTAAAPERTFVTLPQSAACKAA